MTVRTPGKLTEIIPNIFHIYIYIYIIESLRMKAAKFGRILRHEINLQVFLLSISSFEAYANWQLGPYYLNYFILLTTHLLKSIKYFLLTKMQNAIPSFKQNCEIILWKWENLIMLYIRCHIINTFTYDLKILNNMILFTFYTIALNRGGQINRLLPIDCH
jgi:hypothetical protein